MGASGAGNINIGGGSGGDISINAGGGANGDPQSIELDVGPIKIKIVGSFNGKGKWEWNANRPGDNATVHQVKVGDLKDGKPNLTYDPPSLNAAPGDFVQFNFMAQNHTVTQSTLDAPCKKLKGGMDSGFMPNPNNSLPIPPSMIIEVNDTQPLFFYCRQKEHCGKGMAFGINAGGDQVMAKLMENAKAQNGTGSPGAAASNSTSSQNGLPESQAIPAPTSTPLTDLVPGAAPPAQSGSGSGNAGSGPGAGGQGAGAGGPGAGGQNSGPGANGAGGSSSGAGGQGAGAGGNGTGAGAGAGAAGDECACSCLCDIGQAVLGGGFLNTTPLPPAAGVNKRAFRSW